MITVDKFRFGPWLWALIAVAVFVVLYFMAKGDGGDDATAVATSNQAADNASGATSMSDGASNSDVSAIDERTPLALTTSDIPNGLDAEEWAAIQAATADHPNPEAERQRLISFLGFQRRAEAWQAAVAAGDLAKQEQLGQALLNDLPVHLANAEISMPEAMMLCAAVSHAADANEQLAQQKVEQCQVRLSQSLPAPDQQKLRQRDACEADWRDRQAKLTAEFMSQSAQVRAAKQLQFERALQAARVEVFAAAGCSGVY